MGSDFAYRQLKDCATWYSGGTPRKSSPEFWNGDIPWISAKSLSGTFIATSEDKVTELGAKNGTRLLPKDSILFVVRGMSLKSEFRVGITTQEVTFNQDLKALVANDDIDPYFLMYTLKSKTHEILGLVEEAGHGTGVLPTPVIQQLEIPVPSLSTQKAIAKAILNFDKKITLNRQINQTLEQMAQTLFKSWFVDFDPVMDNALDAGNPIPDELQHRAEARKAVRESDAQIGEAPGKQQPLPDDVRQLFPNAFEESELGWVPKGWVYRDAESVASVSIGKTPPRKESQWFSETPSDNVTWVSIRDMGGYGAFTGRSSEYLTQDAVSKFNVKRVPKDSVLLSFKLTLGRVAIAHSELTTNEAIAHFVSPKFGLNKEFLYSYLSTFDYGRLGSTSSIATAVNSKIIKRMPILVPTESASSAFECQVGQLFEKMKLIDSEVMTLTELRDTLLPKLISGELRLDDVEAAVEQDTVSA